MGLVLAALPGVSQARSADNMAPFVELGAVDSQPGETKDAFVLRVGQAMAQEAEGRREVCGMIMVNLRGDAWRVRLVSNAEHMGCVALRFRETKFVASGETIHTHQVRGRMSLDQAQRLPEEEFAHGPGYVVAGGAVFSLQHELAPVQRLGYYNLKAPGANLVGGGYIGRPQISEQTQETLKAQLFGRRAPSGNQGGSAPGSGRR